MSKYGKQYLPDDDFKKRARLHQSMFRVNSLFLEDYKDYGNRLTDIDAIEGKNFYRFPGLFDEVIKRYGTPKKGTVSPLFSDMLRSEHIPCNVFIPMKLDEKFKTSGKNVLNAFLGGSIKEITKIEIEYAPSPKEEYLNDRTSFDAYIEYIHSSDGKKGILGIEVKYTEREYPLVKGSKQEADIQNESSPYYKVAEQSKIYKPNSNDALKSDKFRQSWRNQLLAEKMRLTKNLEIEHSTQILLYPKDNLHQQEVGLYYNSFLKEEYRNIKFKAITFEDFISVGFKMSSDNDWKEYLRYLATRYTFNFHQDTIEIGSDPLTFKQQITENFGDNLYYLTELFFEHAVKQADKGLLRSAIVDAKKALTFNEYQTISNELIYLYGFISQVLLELDKINESKLYCEKAFSLLDEEDEDYETQKSMLQKLKELIDSESWKDDTDRMD